MFPLSVCIITYNEEDKITRCLQSVTWADEIIIIDSGSTDKTIELCKPYTSKIEPRDWSGYVDQKNYALSQAKNDWVLSLDADEEVSPELQQEMQQLLQSNSIQYAGFKVPRLTYYLGKWIYHSGWYPDYQVRLFRKSRAQWAGSSLHERVQLDGKLGSLHASLYHYSYRDLTEHLETVNRFATLWAQEQLKKKKTTVNTFLFLFHPIIKFFECFFWKRGFLDGYRGLIIAGISAFYVFLKYTKLFELST